MDLKLSSTSAYEVNIIVADSINTLVGCWVACGLLMIKLQKSKWHWQERRRYRPWISPIHVIVYASATAFLAITVFIPPSEGSPFSEAVSGLPYWLVPLIGVTAPLWGLVWYGGLCAYSWYSGRQLNVTREAYWTPDPDCKSLEYTQQAEIVDITWQITPRDNMSEDFTSLVEMKQPTVVHHRSVASNRGSRRDVSPLRDGGGMDRGSRRLSDSFDD